MIEVLTRQRRLRRGQHAVRRAVPGRYPQAPPVQILLPGQAMLTDTAVELAGLQIHAGSRAAGQARQRTRNCRRCTPRPRPGSHDCRSRSDSGWCWYRSSCRCSRSCRPGNRTASWCIPGPACGQVKEAEPAVGAIVRLVDAGAIALVRKRARSDRRRSRSRCRPGRCRSAQTLPQPRQLFGSSEADATTVAQDLIDGALAAPIPTFALGAAGLRDASAAQAADAGSVLAGPATALGGRRAGLVHPARTPHMNRRCTASRRSRS